MATSIRMKDYRSDIVLTLHMTLGGETVNVPQHDFLLRFFTEHEARHYDCGRIKGEWLHCVPDESDTTLLTCYIKNHGLGCGMLQCLYIDLSPNDGMEDGVQRTFSVSGIDLELVDDASDDTQAVDGTVVVDINAVLSELHDAADAAETSRLKNIASITYQQSTADGGTNLLTITQNNGTVHQWQIKNGSKGDKGDKGDTTEGSTGLIFGKLVGNSFYDENGDEADKRADWLYIDKEARSAYRWGAGSFEAIGGRSDWDDKKYAPFVYNGLGRKSLKKNMVSGENVLTAAMLSDANTEFYIQYDYDLKNTSVNLPSNVSLVFMGGSIKNGTLIGNNTRIVAKRGVQIFDNITIQGTWDVDEAYSSWFKMHKAGYKIASVSQSGITIYKGTDNIYYKLNDLTLVGSDYYVTSTLDGGEVVSGSIKVTATTYATFKIEGDNTDYVAAPSGVPGVFDSSGYAQYDDTDALQSLFDLRGKKTIVEDGVYMFKADANYSFNRYSGIYVDAHNDSEIVLEGWLKVLPNNRDLYYAFDVIGCQNIMLTGNGGIQGDLLEHLSTGGEAGMALSVANTKNLIVDGLTFSYAWGDCIYCHWWTNGRESVIPRGNDLQMNHTFKNVRIIYGGRTGLVYERGDNVVVDGCYFYGNGQVRGKATNSAIDIEPFAYDTPIRYVKNFEFKNNVFKNNANNLRLERCANCSVHNNEIELGWCGIQVVWHTDVNYIIPGTSNQFGWEKSYLKIYNNTIKRCTNGLNISSSSQAGHRSDNIDFYGNTIISCSKVVSLSDKLVSCNIYNNVAYGCGGWNIMGALVNCDISHNSDYACILPQKSQYIDNSWKDVGGGEYVYIAGQNGSSGSAFHHNSFYLNYGETFNGLGENGTSGRYRGLPVGLNCYFMMKVVQQGEKFNLIMHDNFASDDCFLYWNTAYTYNEDKDFYSIRNEKSEVFLLGEKFKSSEYGDEGVVESGAFLSFSWLDNVRDFTANMEVESGEIIKNGNYYKLCRTGGVCGATLTEEQMECGSAVFTSKPAKLAPGGTLKIGYTTRGTCSSSSRPTTFLFAGRKMRETDTNKNIVYNGTTWVEEKEIEAITSSEINTGTSETLKGVTAKLLRDNFYTEGEIDAKLGDVETLLANI